MNNLFKRKYTQTLLVVLSIAIVGGWQLYSRMKNVRETTAKTAYFVLAAKNTEKQKFSFVTNYMGMPEAMYREDGEAVWTCELNGYGKVRKFQGESKTDCPFRFCGMYEDAETGLCYNRMRYYSPSEGIYLSQDPIRLAGNNPTLYGYVKDPNTWTDVFGLNPSILYHYTNQAGMEGILASGTIRPSLKEVNPRDARYGNGQYLSDIVPGTKTPSQLGREFINVPNKHKYTHYVAIDVTGLDVVKGRDGVFVIRGDAELDVSDRIVDSGKIKCGG
jgi:RHS repeat-associated protein